jgi:hypothetical protein
MRAPHRVALGSVVGYAATLLVILAVPAVLIPAESRSAHFWWRVAWAAFLATIVWAYVGGLVGTALSATKPEQPPRGMLPAIGLTAVIYAVISGALMLGNACLPESPASNRLHLALQIAIAAAALVVCVFAHFGRVRADTAPPP